MTKDLTVLKKETRILGLDACNLGLTIGTIVRGGLYLDGVSAFSSQISSDQTAKQIRETRYFPELRMIMIHGPNERLNSKTIERVSGLPVIEGPRLGNQANHPQRRQGTRYNQWSSRGIKRTTLHKTLELTMQHGEFPEPIRIAHLLAKLHIFGQISQDKR